jgi:hypothetical protein
MNQDTFSAVLARLLTFGAGALLLKRQTSLNNHCGSFDGTTRLAAAAPLSARPAESDCLHATRPFRTAEAK